MNVQEDKVVEILKTIFDPEIPVDIYASNWFITMFAADLPFDMTPSIIDVFLLEGHKGLLRIGLALLSYVEPILLSLGFDEIMEFLSHASARESHFKNID